MTTVPRIAVIANPNGGIGVYVLHSWQPLSCYAPLRWIAPRTEPVGESVAAQGLPTAFLLDPGDPESAGTSAATLAEDVDLVNLHVATAAVAHLEFYRRFIEASRRHGLTVVLTVHNVHPFSVSQYEPDALRALYELGDAFLVGTEAEERRLRASFAVGQRPLSVARLGPLTLLDRQRWDREEARRLLGIPATAPLALFFGSFRHEKGLETLIEAFPAVQSRHPDAWLLVSTSPRFNPGGAPQLAAIQEGARGRSGWVFHNEYVPEEQIEVLFRAADVVVLPYRRVTQSAVRGLAAAFARAVVVTDAFEDGADLDGVWGRCVPSDDPASLASALVDLFARSRSDRDGLGRAGFERAARHDSWDEYARRAASLYRAAWASTTARRAAAVTAST